MYGRWPVNTIDHIDRNRSNNAISNLRDVTQLVNAKNIGRKLGGSGIHGIHKHRSKWEVAVVCDGKRIRLGIYNSIPEAEMVLLSVDIANSAHLSGKPKLYKSKNIRQELTHQQLVQDVFYDPHTGLFYRRRNGQSGRQMGYNESGYIRITIHHHRYFAHRLAIFYVTAEWPNSDAVIDHINGDPSDNRYCNLRVTSQYENLLNMRTRRGDHHGIRITGSNRYEASIRAFGKNYHLGTFDTAAEAQRVLQTFRKDIKAPPSSGASLAPADSQNTVAPSEN